MATILDTSIVSFLTPIFIFILLFAIFFALIKKFKIFGDKSENLAAIAAFSLSILIVLSTPARDVVKSPGFYNTMIVIFLIIFLISLTKAFGPIFQVSGQAGFWESTKRVVFSPRVLGGLFLLMIAAFTVRYLGSTK